jgi:hypothetical protein
LSRRATAAALFVTAAALLLLTANHGVTEAWVDPVSRLEAQDEATYLNTALRMAERGDWLTPYFMDRLALYKPPLLYWAEAASLKAFGISRAALRLPAALAAAGVCVLVFLWGEDRARGLTAALLVFASHQFFVLARLGLTDALLLLWTTGALFALHREPKLERTWVWFGACSGLAILTKSVAGLLAPLALILYWLATRRPAFAALAKAAAVTLAVALPWHIYQYAAHPQWFWAEYVQTELLGYGTGAPPQTSEENHAWFYVKRLALVDPILALLAVAGGWFAWRERRQGVAAAWVAAQAIAVLAFSYRSAAYLLPFVPPLALLAAARGGRESLTIAGAALAAKLYFAAAPWGLPWRGEFRNPALPLLESYCAERRGAELILVATDEQFYAASLPLQRVRYLYTGDPPARRFALDFDWLGIRMPVADFLRGDFRAYAGRLEAFGLPSAAPLATVLLAPTKDEVERLIAARPAVDFYLPAGWIDAERLAATHEVRKVSDRRWFALARGAVRRAPDRRPCRI